MIGRRGFSIVLLVLAFVWKAWGADSNVTSYRLLASYKIPDDGTWDYLFVDSSARQLYVSHGTQIEVLEPDTGKIVGQIPDTPGVHGVAIAPELKRGFTSNGGNKSVTVFDAETLKPIKNIGVAGTDFILYDPFTKRIFPMNQKVTVIDAVTENQVGELDLGGVPEAAVSDAKGTLYVNLANKNALAVVDPRALSVKQTYAIDNCTSPHSLAFDATNQRLFVGCREGLAVLDANTGKLVGRSRMCSGVDAAAFDPSSKLIFESCGEGVVSVIRQVTPDFYWLVDTVKTEIGAKTMAFDEKTKKLFLSTAEVELSPNDDPKFPFPFKPQPKPGSFHVLVVAP